MNWLCVANILTGAVFALLMGGMGALLGRMISIIWLAYRWRRAEKKLLQMWSASPVKQRAVSERVSMERPQYFMVVDIYPPLRIPGYTAEEAAQVRQEIDSMMRGDNGNA